MGNEMPERMNRISAYVFDAYGRLFDVGSVALSAQDELSGRWQTPYLWESFAEN